MERKTTYRVLHRKQHRVELPQIVHGRFVQAFEKYLGQRMRFFHLNTESNVCFKCSIPFEMSAL